MRTLRFIHTADWHADGDEKKKAKLEASLQQLVEYCSKNKVDAIIHSGDVWERSQKFEKNSGVPVVIKYLRELSKLVDFIFITKGNNSHDEPGSISLLHQIEPNTYAYEYPVVLGVKDGTIKQHVFDLLRDEHEINEFNFIVTLVPYPTKASLLINDSIDNNNANFIEKFEQIFEHIGEVTQPYTCPKILTFHGNVVGSRLSTGQTLVSQDIMVAPSTLELAIHDYYALGHIHLRQEIKWNMIYAGSVYNKNWGETDKKSFEVIEFEFMKDFERWIITNQQRIHFNCKSMVKIDCDFINGEFIYYADDADMKLALSNDSEVRLKIKIKENERNLLTENKIEELKITYGQDTKIELNIMPSERDARSESIMNCKTLLDEVKEYAKVIGEQINDSIEKKVLKMMEEGVRV